MPALEPKLPKWLFVYKSGELQSAMFWHAQKANSGFKVTLYGHWNQNFPNRCLFISLVNCRVLCFGMRRRQIWVDTVWPFDFSFVGHLLSFISVGKVFAKILRFMKFFVRKNGSGRFS